MDLVAAAIGSAGFLLAARGQEILGTILFVASFLGFAIAVSRSVRPRLVLPFSFSSYMVLLAVTFFAVVVSVRTSRSAPAVCFGLMVYYYACVSLVEKRVRYVPWGTGLAWRTATRAERPITYWSFVGLFLVLAAGLLGVAFAAVSGWIGVTA